MHFFQKLSELNAGDFIKFTVNFNSFPIFYFTDSFVYTPTFIRPNIKLLTVCGDRFHDLFGARTGIHTGTVYLYPLFFKALASSFHGLGLSGFYMGIAVLVFYVNNFISN
jgi:hypothetical protein